MIALDINNKVMVIVDLETKKPYALPVNSLFRIRKKYPHLRKRPLVIGFVGPRGSGKSVGTARMVIVDYLLGGHKVWANMDIGCRIGNNGNSTMLRAENWEKLDIVDLDTIYENGCLVIEEANMTMMEARRAMRDENLKFSYILQQLRKRRMNLIWNAQSEMHVDDRLRFQTDIFIKCTDVSLLPSHRNVGVGELTLCRYYDYSGVVTGNILSSRGFIDPFWEGIFANKPWWNSFDTWKMQGLEEEAEGEEDQEFMETVDSIEQYIIDNGRVNKDDMWHEFGIETHSEKIRIGTMLSNRGIKQNRRRSHLFVKEYE